MVSPTHSLTTSGDLAQSPTNQAISLRQSHSMSTAEKTANLKQVLDSIAPATLTHYLPHNSIDIYQRRRIAVETFKVSDDFNALRESTVGAMKHLHTLLAPGESFEDSQWALLRDRLGFNGAMTANQPIQDGLFELYTHTCQQLRQLGTIAKCLQMPAMPFSDIQKSSITSKVKDLTSEFKLCGPGISSKTHSTLIDATHELFPVDISTRFFHTKDKVAREVIHDWAKRNLSHFHNFEGNEIHIVNAWYKQVKDVYFLNEQPEDFHAVSSYISDTPISAQIELEKLLDDKLSSSSIAGNLAEEMLGELQQNCDLSDSEWLARVISNLKELIPKWGNVDLLEVARFDDNLFPVGLMKNPTLLALNFMDQHNLDTPEQEGKVLFSNQPSEHDDAAQTNSLLSDNDSPAAIYELNQLVWISRHTDAPEKPISRELVCFENLDKTRLKDTINAMESWCIEAPLIHIMHECYRNMDCTPTQVFRDRPWNNNELEFFKSALRMTEQLLPEEQKAGFLPDKLQANMRFVDHLMEGSLDPYFSDEDFEKIADSMQRGLTINEVLRPGSYMAAPVLETNTAGSKLFCSLVKKMHMHTAYDPNQALKVAFETKDIKRLEAVIEHWPPGKQLGTAQQNNETPLLTRAIGLNPKASTFEKMLLLSAEYPVPSVEAYCDPLFTACMQMRGDLVETMINTGYLPKEPARYHQSLLKDTLNCEDKQINDAAALAAYKAMQAMGIKLPEEQHEIVMTRCRQTYAYSTAAEVLKQAGKLNSSNKLGLTMLHEAVRQGNLAFAEALLHAGADVNYRSSISHVGKTALHMAYRKGDQAMISLLKTHGADENLRDFKMRLPQSLANRLPAQFAAQLRQ